MAHIFISYHHSDTRFVEALQSQLLDAEFQTWRDPDLPAGESWREAIDQAIRDAAALALVLSPAGKASPYVNYEWAFALGAGVKVIPLLLGLTMEELHPRLAHLQSLDFTDRNTRPWERLFLALGSSIRRDAGPGMPPVVEQAARALDSLAHEERMEAIRTLVQTEDPAAAQLLAEKGLTHPVRDVRVQSAFGLRKRQDVRAVPGLLEVARMQARNYNHDDPWVDGRLLAEFGPPAVPDLIRALDDPDDSVRWAAGTALGALKEDAALPFLTGQLGTQTGQTRSHIVYLLGEFGDRAPVRPLAGCLADQSSDVQNTVVEALGKIGGPEAVAALAGVVAGTNVWTVRVRAAAVLGRIGDQSCVPALIALLNSDSSPAECKAAAEALAKIGGADSLAALAAALTRKGFENRAVAASALGALKQAEAVPALVAFLRDKNKDVRRRAAEALAEIDTPEAKKALAAAGCSKSR